MRIHNTINIPLFWVLILFTVQPLFAQQLDQKIPLNPDVKTGKLKNGLTYFVQKNAKPEKRVELRLVINAGSILEDDNQQGLAHFTEHMMFNGTKNFKKNELVDYLQSVGVKFGADINAYTSFDETVYMLPLPSDDPEILEKGFQILEDWAHLASFENEEIDKERGVVIEEWRSRKSAGQRMFDLSIGVLMKDSRYAKRLPIGKKEILENFDYETLKSFYKDWYRPDLMAVVVVGDIDVTEMEQKINDHFGNIKPVKKPRERKEFSIPDHNETLVSIATDKEQAFTSVRVTYKQDKDVTKTLGDWKRQLSYQLYNGMLNRRLSELSQKADPPFLGASSSYGGFFGRSKDAYTSFAQVKEDGILTGLETVLTENKRVLDHGFLQSELDRYKKVLLNAYEKQYKERNKTNSGRIVREYVSYFLEQSPSPGISWEYENLQKVLPTITLEEINALPKKWISTKNRVVIIEGAEKEGLKVPGEAEVRAVLDAVDKAKVTPYEDKVITEPLIAKMPKPGKVTASKPLKELGATELTLSNGVKVVLKTTDFKEDEILMSAYSFGGTSLASDADYYSATNASTVVVSSGVREFSPTDLRKMMSGKTANVTPFIGELSEGFRGNAAPKDLETFFQLLHLYFTAPRKDQEAFTSFVNRRKSILKNVSSNPQYFFIDQQIKILTQDHPRGGGIPKPEDVDKINLDRAIALYKDRFADPSDFVFFFVGNVNEEALRPYLENYLASIPAKNRTEMFKDLGVRPPKGKVEKTFERGTDEKSQVAIVFTGEVKDSKDKYNISAFAEALTIKLVEVLREEKGGVYGTSARANTQKYPYDSYSVSISFTCAPESAQDLIDAAFGEIKKIQENGPTEEDVNKVKEARKRDLEKNLKENRWWLSGLQKVYYEEIKHENLTEKKMLDKIESIQAKDLQQIAKKYCNLNQVITMVMNPEEVEEEVETTEEQGADVNEEAFKNVDADQVIDNYLAAIGGKEKLRTVKSAKTISFIEVLGQKMEMLSLKEDGKSYLSQTMGGNEMMKIIFDGTKGKSTGMQGNKTMEGDEALGLKDQAAIVYELDYAARGIKAVLDGVEDVDGKKAFKITFTNAVGKSNEKWYDVESGLVVKLKSAEGQEFKVIDYTEKDGFKIPSKMTFKAEGFDMTMVTETIEYNIDIEDTYFEIK